MFSFSFLTLALTLNLNLYLHVCVCVLCLCWYLCLHLQPSHAHPDAAAAFVRAVCCDLIQACDPSTVIYLRDACAGAVFQCLTPAQFAMQRRQFRDAQLEHVLGAQLLQQQQQQQQQSQQQSQQQQSQQQQSQSQQQPPQQQQHVASLSARLDRLRVGGASGGVRPHRLAEELTKIWDIQEVWTARYIPSFCSLFF